MGGLTPTAQNVETYDHLVDRLNELPFSHLQVVKAPNDLAGTPIAELQDTIGHFRERYRGVLIANKLFLHILFPIHPASSRTQLGASPEQTPSDASMPYPCSVCSGRACSSSRSCFS
jgi:hypothetical protein